MTDWDALASHLTACSREICADNGCTEDEHRCESYAYIAIDEESPSIDDPESSHVIGVTLLDVCSSDYFRGCSRDYIYLSLPFEGDGSNLRNAVQNEWDSQC